MLNVWNWFWNLCVSLESISFAVAVVLLVWALAWGKNGLKKLNKKREGQLLWLSGWSAIVYLGLLSFTVTVEFLTYLWRLLPSH
jgi:hypothetical protein